MEKLLCEFSQYDAKHYFLNQIYSLKDLVVRTEMNQLVTDLVNLDRVGSLLKTIATRRRYLAERERRYSAQGE